MEHNTPTCGHDHCGTCCGGGCSGCSGELELTQAELDLLRLFAQIPFLPVARQSGSELPIFLENGPNAAEASGGAILALQGKQLIELDYGLPLQNFDYTAYGRHTVRGSMALTEKGQRVVELLDIQGIEA